MSEIILLIDDDQSLRRVTEYNLSAKGFNPGADRSQHRDSWRRSRREPPTSPVKPGAC